MEGITHNTETNILVVDDTPANLRLLTNILSERGYRARAVPTGQMALAAVQAEKPDLILLDIRMHGMNGYQVCEQLKAQSETRDIPVIYISALDATQDKVRAFRSGGVDYITKPFHVEEVIARVETHLALRRLQQELVDANEKMARELLLAGQVQSGLLPQKLPQVAGWQFSAGLVPARDTSGDFYDLNLMPGGRVYLLVADVVDKGAGAAMFMALCVTLLRTYLAENPQSPEQVFHLVNQRILGETGSGQFVTVFLGLLDLQLGTLTWCNAGHPPPILVRAASEEPLIRLAASGMALGVDEGGQWEPRSVEIRPGSVLLLYTDGVTDAVNPRGKFYDSRSIEAVLLANREKSAEAIQEALLSDLNNFCGGAPQQDDIALVVASRL